MLVANLTVSGGIIWARDEHDLGVEGTEGLQLCFKRRATGSDQHDPVLTFDAFDQLREFLLEALGVGLSGE